MQHKKIKKEIVNQLKKQFPNWKRMSRKAKKEMTNKVLNEYVNISSHNIFKNNFIQDAIDELTGIDDQIFNQGIYNLCQMEELINQFESSNLIPLHSINKENFILNDELSFIDNIIDNQIIDHLLAYEGFSPSMRILMPHHLLRAELLKILKYPEISYRKYCTQEYLGMHQKENKYFIGIPLHKNCFIDHTVLSKFRNSLTFTMLVNLLVYIIYYFQHAGFLDSNFVYGIDSTELAVDNQKLLASIDIDGKKIRIYDDLDCDCGKRRNKKDKSTYVIGYRLHTLTAINPVNGHSHPLVSLLAPANHHDSLFAHPLITLAQAIGLDVKLVTADEAYHDNQNEIYNNTGTYLITPPNQQTSIPDYVDIEKKQVFCNKHCETPMEYVGIEDDMHEFKCNACEGICPFSSSCQKYRQIPIDSGQFQRIIPFLNDNFSQAIEIRKHSERPFNLLKNREGLKEFRARGKKSILSRCFFTQIATLLITMAGKRNKKKKQKENTTEYQASLAA